MKIAIISLNANASRSDTAHAGELIAGLDQIFPYSLYGSDSVVRPEVQKEPQNFLLSLAATRDFKFDMVLVGASVFLYDTCWTRDLIASICDAVASDGSLCFASYMVASRRTLNGLSDEIVRGWLGSVDLQQRARFSIFNRPRLVPRPARSMVDWYVNRGPLFGALNMGQAFASVGRTALPSLSIKGTPLSAPHPDVPVRVIPQGISAEPTVLPYGKIGTLEYLSLGVAMKVGFIKTIIRDFLGTSKPLTIVDHGTGSGMVPVQLLLESDIQVAAAWGVEPTLSYLDLTADILDYFGASAKDRFRLAIASSENFEYGEPVDVVIFLHMLLLIDRGRLPQVLDLAWNALRPGGLMIFLEYPKGDSSRSLSYYEKMFTPQELEEAIGGFGEIHRYHQKEARVIGASEAGNNPIFRVIQKQHV